jgi:SAM-dependent methyltransferase
MIKKYKDNLGNNHIGEKIISKDGYEVIECEKCQFKHIVPFIEDKEQEQFYSEEFYQNEINDYIEKAKSDIEWYSIEANEKFDYFDNYFKNSPGVIFDIGSGPGYFLKIGSERGWKMKGIEPGKPAFDYSINHLNQDVENQFFNKLNYKTFGKFDVIHFRNVLEHITDPINILKMAKEILKPNGLICVTSPNDFNPLQLVANEKYDNNFWWVLPKHHVNYFDTNSIEKVFTTLSMEIIHKTASFPLELFMMMGDNYIGNNNLGREIHLKRVELEKSFLNAGKAKLKNKIYEKFADVGVGREFTVIAKLKNE